MRDGNSLKNPLAQRSLGLRLVALFCLFSVSWAFEDKLDRSGRYFSLFNVVRFKNEMCTLSGNVGTGTCLTLTDCEKTGGRAQGNCAAGFGVCCGFTINACGGDVNKNCTYLENKGYPVADTTKEVCTFRFNRIQGDICMIRLDFVDVTTNVAPPAMATLTDGTIVPTAGNCLDEITVSSSHASNPVAFPPVVCGQLSGQHMYFETGNSGNAGELKINMGSTQPTKFRIKASYIECHSLSKPPQGCVQYHTGMAGSIMSFNHAGAQLLAEQSYSICMRQEEGMCSIAYSESGQATPDPFYLSAAPFANTVCQDRNHLNILSMGSGSLLRTNVAIAEVVPPSSVYSVRENFISTRCGTIFSEANLADVPGVLQGLRGVPFIVGVHTVTATDIQGITPDEINQLDGKTGFNLDYRQLPC